jgi:hypothetical protein
MKVSDFPWVDYRLTLAMLGWAIGEGIKLDAGGLFLD